MPETIQVKMLFDLEKTIAKKLIEKFSYPWEVLPHIKDFILMTGEALPSDRFFCPVENVWVARSARVAPTAFLMGPCIIDEHAEIRHCAFLRGSAIIGKGAVVGNSTEIKNAVLFDNAQVPHFNYVGDSLLGFSAHLGAGAITSNVKSDKTRVCVIADGVKIQTGMKKFGAALGDFAEIGCNSVLCPGTIIGRNTNVYPLSCVRGVVGADRIYKSADNIVMKS